ncbi:MAG: LLM class flavin-dependent oxidoreductase [Micromonosporaceae bacterium]
MRVDVVLRGMSLPAMAECVEAAESAPAPVTLWLPESPGDRHSLTTAAALLGRSGRTRIGTGVVPIPLRHTVDLLAGAMTLAEAFPDRFDLGVGSGNVGSLTSAGVVVDRPPLRVVRQFLDAYAQLRARGGLAALVDVPAAVAPPPVFLAAHNRKMIELGVRRADGVILNMVPASDLPATLAHVRASADRSGRAGTLGMFLLAALGSDEVESVRAARRVLIGFLRSPVVRTRLRSFGSRHADLADEVALLPPAVDDEALARALPAEVVADFAVTSTAALAARLAVARDYGFGFVALSVFPVPLRLRRPFPPVPEEGAALAATVAAIEVIAGLVRADARPPTAGRG